MKKISSQLYKKIIETVPILCVDAVILHKRKFLLVKRKNNPLKERWYVPGGRVLKGETMEKGLLRKVKEELSIAVKILGPLGYCEDFYKENEVDAKNGIHTLSIVFLANPLSLNIKLDSQSSGWRFSKNLPKEFKIKPFYGTRKK